MNAPPPFAVPTAYDALTGAYVGPDGLSGLGSWLSKGLKILQKTPAGQLVKKAADFRNKMNNNPTYRSIKRGAVVIGLNVIAPGTGVAAGAAFAAYDANKAKAAEKAARNRYMLTDARARALGLSYDDYVALSAAAAGYGMTPEQALAKIDKAAADVAASQTNQGPGGTVNIPENVTGAPSFAPVQRWQVGPQQRLGFRGLGSIDWGSLISTIGQGVNTGVDAYQRIRDANRSANIAPPSPPPQATSPQPQPASSGSALVLPALALGALLLLARR